MLIPNLIAPIVVAGTLLFKALQFFHLDTSVCQRCVIINVNMRILMRSPFRNMLLIHLDKNRGIQVEGVLPWPCN